jgi:hypothetical protein
MIAGCRFSSNGDTTSVFPYGKQRQSVNTNKKPLRFCTEGARKRADSVESTFSRAYLRRRRKLRAVACDWVESKISA